MKKIVDVDVYFKHYLTHVRIGDKIIDPRKSLWRYKGNTIHEAVNYFLDDILSKQILPDTIDKVDIKLRNI